MMELRFPEERIDSWSEVHKAIADILRTEMSDKQILRNFAICGDIFQAKKGDKANAQLLQVKISGDVLRFLQDPNISSFAFAGAFLILQLSDTAKDRIFALFRAQALKDSHIEGAMLVMALCDVYGRVCAQQAVA